MPYLSIDTLQRSLADSVFAHTSDAKKAAGRALGTLVEIITYYLLREWGLGRNIAIETRLPEFGNPEITHNVEFTLHKMVGGFLVGGDIQLPITASKLIGLIPDRDQYTINKSAQLLSSANILKNSCQIAEDSEHLIMVEVNDEGIGFLKLLRHPFAMFECKRVGVEEGQKKGPQTIEKAKQGAYVAIKSSPLQKIRNDRGELLGIYFTNGEPHIGNYETLLDGLVGVPGNNLVLTYGIVSNHGNWFTSDDMNKEMKVLAQSYDRLLFLTDEGLSQFITETILNPENDYMPIREAFLTSYSAGKKQNSFTKSKIALTAHYALMNYFSKNINEIEDWFNVISPASLNLQEIKKQLINISTAPI